MCETKSKPSATMRETTAKPSYPRLGLAAIIAIGMSVILPSQMLPSNARAEQVQPGCNDVNFVFARGSGEALGGPNYTSWSTEIAKHLQGSGLEYTFYDLGTNDELGYKYPAVEVGGSFVGIANMIGAYASGGDSYEFGRSVQVGVDGLVKYVDDISEACPQTKFIFGGYSQGAMVVMRALEKIDPKKVLYVSTFGDPKLYLPEGAPIDIWTPKVPDACFGKNFSIYRAWVPDCWAYNGILGGRNPYLPENYYAGRIGIWCNNRDMMCSSGMSVKDHISYVSGNVYQIAAKTIAHKAIYQFVAQFAPSTKHETTAHDVLFMFDNTRSMLKTLEKYKDEAKKLAEQIFGDGGRVALYSYNDLKTHSLPKELCNFHSCDTNTFDAGIESIEPFGGADDPESLLSALIQGLDNLDWKQAAIKTIVVLTDAAFHDPDYDEEETTLDDVVQRTLEIDPVNIYVLAPEDLRDDYAELTSLTGGKFFSIDDDEEIQLSTQEIYNRPVAKLALDNYYGNLNDELTFDASESYSFGEEKLRFDWDLDGDGKFERKNAASIVSAKYSQAFDDFIQVRVSDEFGSSTMSAKVKIASPETVELPTTITQLDAVKTGAGTFKVTYETDADNVLVSLGDLPLGLTQPEHGSGELQITDIGEDLTLTLTPYSSSERRGVSRSITLSQDLRPAPQPDPDPQPAPTLQPTPGELVSGILPGHSPSTATIQPDTDDTSLPLKAPNTGVRSLPLPMGT